MASEQTQRIISRLFEGFDLFENGKLTEESLMEHAESNLSAIENPDLVLVEERLTNLIAFLDEASYIVPYSKKRDSVIAELNKARRELSRVLDIN